MPQQFSSEEHLPSREAVSVSELNRSVASLLSEKMSLMRVRGEVAGFTCASSGHWYFTLKDAKAQVRCVMYRSRNGLLTESPRNGEDVIVLARVNIYEPRGEFQLTLEWLQPAGAGRGALYEAFLRLKERLALEGLFDAARKRALPYVPRAIGIVTSLQAAALHDVLATLARRAPYVRRVVYPVPVQGEGASARIVQMLAVIEQRREVDVVLLVRGGGAIEDLAAFNDEALARAIAALSVPVIVGVGHESDVTIADFVADVRAPTPTAAAELVAPSAIALLEAVVVRHRRLHRQMRRTLEERQQALDFALRTLPQPTAALYALAHRLAKLRVRLRRAFEASVQMHRQTVVTYQARCTRSRVRLPAFLGQVQALQRRLNGAGKQRLVQWQQQVAHCERTLAALDPQGVLQRGYALVRVHGGALVCDAAELAPNARIDIQFARGTVVAQVQ